jgi:two-component system NtrC family response regulator
MELQQSVREGEQLGLLLGRSSAMQHVYTHIRKAAEVDIPLLLEGESGTGKDLAAQTIHAMSLKSDGPYIPVNLGAFPDGVVASELFGHEKGAFTGAIAQRKGKFEQAQNGSIFLDEVESIDQNVQVSLLRLIESQQFFRIGGRQQISTNARMLAASNRDLHDLVDQGSFREDLYYRLEIFPIKMPPLCERLDDVPLLIAHFVKRANTLMQKQVTRVEQACLDGLEAYDWPGNVRELRNAVHRAVLLCEGDTLLPEHFPKQCQGENLTSPLQSLHFAIGTPLDEIERTVIARTLEYTHNNRTEAAALLGISRRALYNRLHKHQLQ